MIEDGEESILRFFSTVEKLHIVNDQYINQLIKMNEIIYGIIAAMVNKLVNEFLGAYIQYHFVRLHPFYFVTDGLGQVGFAETHASINNQWVKRIGSWLFSHGFTGSPCHTITVAFNKSVERIIRVELRVDVHFFQPW